ncbi:MAG TPA: c-type cytochrome [Stellaceae bacterium]|nr:c-type cytochrome [Stellaceae bacterium]
MRLARLTAFGFIIAVSVTTASAQDAPTVGDPQTGRDYALRNCTSCHMVSPRQSPPVRVAPSFQAIANMRSTTEMSLHAFLSTPHPKMPNFIVPPSDAQDVTAYILSLRKRP